MKTKFLNLFSQKKQETIKEGIVNSLIINIFTKILGYLKNLTIATILGFSQQTDSFFMAVGLIGIFLIFTDVFDSLGIPNLIEAKNKGEFEKFSSLLFSFTLVITILSLMLSIILLPLILKIPSGFSDKAIEDTKISYIILLPFLFFNFIFHHFGAILRSQRRFIEYFIGELIISLVSFITTVFGLLVFKDFKILSLSLSVAQIFGTAYMLYVGKDYLHIRFYFDEKIKKLFTQFLNLSALYAIIYLYPLIDKTFASYLEEKAISALHYGIIIMLLPKNILKFEILAIVPLSETKGSIEKLKKYLSKLIIYSIPFLIFFFFFPKLPVKLLFGYGAFSKIDIHLTAEALKYYSLSLPFALAWPVIYRFFQVKEKLTLIVIISIIGIITNAILNYILIFVFKLGLKGICLGTFGAYFAICGISYLIINKQFK